MVESSLSLVLSKNKGYDIMIDYFEMRNIILNEILVPGLVELYAVDYDNIRNGVSEYLRETGTSVGEPYA